MSNKKIEQLSDVQLIKNSAVNLDIPYVFQDGDGNIVNYSLTLSDNTALTFSCKFLTSKLRNGIRRGEEIEICKVICYPDKVGIVIQKTKPLTKMVGKTININGEERYIDSHAHAIIFEAIPNWMTQAASLVNSNKIAPLRLLVVNWLFVVNLLKQLQFEMDAFWDTNTLKKFSPFSEENYRMAVIESAKQAPNNRMLSLAVTRIPEMYENLQQSQFKKDIITAPIEPYRELTTEEEVRNERTAEGRDYGGAK